MKHTFASKLILFAIFLVGFFVRIYSLSWDDHTHLHPDERFLTMVTNTISIPHSLTQYFDTPASSLNPTNYPDYKFFVYGTLPIFLTRFVGEQFNYVGYDQIYLIGRLLSAFVDSLIIIYLFLLSRLFIKKNNFWVYIPSYLYAFCVLPLQLSHFYAVDTFLVSFLLASFTTLVYFFRKPHPFLLIISAITFGLALASKITAILFLPFLGLFFLSKLITLGRNNFPKSVSTCLNGLIFLGFAFVAFRVFQPYAFNGLFTLNDIFINNLKTLADQSKPSIYFPPSVQWMSTTKFSFPIYNLTIWGLGLPFCFLFLFSLVRLFKKPLSFMTQSLPLIIAAIWIIFLFVYQSLQYTYAMRYYLPIYPFIFLVAVVALSRFKFTNWFGLLFLLHIFWGLAFLGVYSRPQTRVDASLWMYQHVPAGSHLTNEYWDDPLPLYLPGFDPYIYDGEMISLYDPDTLQKWQKLDPIINKANYMIMSSNRLWGSISRVPESYPQTALLYRNIFDGKTKFKLAARFTSYPGFLLPESFGCIYVGPTNYPGTKINTWFERQPHCPYPGFYFRDDTADESFTVYDHPQVLIFEQQ